MAGFGATCLVVAPITAEAGNTITYGTGARVEHLRRVAITYNWDESKFAGDNMTAEYYNHLIDADVEIETTELDGEIAVIMGLEKVKTAAESGANATNALYTMKTESGAPCGVGFIQNLLINNVPIYRAIWVHKVTMRPSNENASTKEDTINWQAPTVNGKAFPVNLDASGEAQVRDFREYSTEAAALTWLKSLANVQ